MTLSDLASIGTLVSAVEVTRKLLVHRLVCRFSSYADFVG